MTKKKREIEPFALEGALLEELTPLHEKIAAFDAEIAKANSDIDVSETEGIEARWEFGRQLLRHRNGKKLPNGWLDAIKKHFDYRPRETQYRVKCAEKFADIKALRARTRDCRTWKKMCRQVLVDSNRSPTQPRPTIKELNAEIERLTQENEALRTQIERLKAGPKGEIEPASEQAPIESMKEDA